LHDALPIFVILDHPQVIISHALIAKLLRANVAFITCDTTHHPTGLMLNLSGHTLQAERFRHQLSASVPLKKQLWQQTVKAKIRNQGDVAGPIWCSVVEFSEVVPRGLVWRS